MSWNLRLSHDNTFLSWHRNAMIATVAGGALIQYQKGQGMTPLAGSGLLMMGGLYMFTGSFLNVYQIFNIRKPLGLSRSSIALGVFNAWWPTALWSISLACLLEETPSWLLEGLRRVEAHLPKMLHSSLFLDPPALYPVCRLLQGVIAHEEDRLAAVRRHAAGHWSLMQQTHEPLTPLDVTLIIKRRLERLEMLKRQLDDLARSDRAVPTAVGAPILDRLRTEIEQLAKVLEADTSPSASRRSGLVWYIASCISTEHRRLLVELDDARRLSQRITAVRFTSVAFAARGQAGVRQASKEEIDMQKAVTRAPRLSRKQTTEAIEKAGPAYVGQHLGATPRT